MHNPNETPAPGPGTVPAAQYPRFGPPEVLRVVEVPAPAPGPHDLVVEVAAVSVNRIDTGARAGRNKFQTGRRLPQPTGLDFSGKVIDVGAQARGFEPGQRVWGFLGTDRLGKQGTAAGRIAVDADLVAPAPASQELADLAALPLVGLTAWQALEELGAAALGQVVDLGLGDEPGTTGAGQLADRENLAVVDPADDGADADVEDAGSVGRREQACEVCCHALTIT